MLGFRVVWISAQGQVCLPLCGSRPGVSEKTVKLRQDAFPLVAAKFINNVRVRCKEGSEQAFLAATEVWVNPDGMTDAYWAKTGERQYCFVGLWESEAALIAARPQMIEHLNAVRDCLEELSPELGVTDPVSGHVVTHKC